MSIIKIYVNKHTAKGYKRNVLDTKIDTADEISQIKIDDEIVFDSETTPLENG